MIYNIYKSDNRLYIMLKHMAGDTLGTVKLITITIERVIISVENDGRLYASI